jgi:hypothetical protein
MLKYRKVRELKEEEESVARNGETKTSGAGDQ